jgi:hypothetical protein
MGSFYVNFTVYSPAPTFVSNLGISWQILFPIPHRVPIHFAGCIAK